MSDELADSVDLIAFLTRSECRVRILERLLEDEALAKRELADDFDVVRTTLTRNLDALVGRGLVTERDRRYEITPTGTLLARELSELCKAARAATHVRPLTDHLDDFSLDVSIERFADADLVEATEANPYAPVARHEQRLAETDHARLVLPATGPDPLETARDRVEDGAVHEVVLTSDVAEALESQAEFAESWPALADSDRVRVNVSDESVPYFLGILDDVVQIGAQDDRGLPVALLETTDRAVRAWAIERFETFEREATRLE